MTVPFVDLKLQYESIKDEIDVSIEKVLKATAFAGGPFVQQFEEEFAAYCNTEYCVAVSCGTSALWLSMLALGIGPGDEVITASNTFIATAEAISYCGARPVFVDIDPATYNLDPALVEAAITPRTKAIVPVHLFGQTADMDALSMIARRHGLFVIEDASQAHGATYHGSKAGSMGDAGCFSFYPGKNLGAYGEAGAVVTNDPAIAERVRVYRDHGQVEKYHHQLIGWNARMDGIQGAVLSVKLKYLEQWTARRRRHARTYDELLQDVDGVVTPVEAPYARHVYHIYAIRTEERDELMAHLQRTGISCGIHYPIPLHLQKAYAFLGHVSGDYPVAERCASHYVSLPMFAELSNAQIQRVVHEIAAFKAQRVSYPEPSRSL